MVRLFIFFESLIILCTWAKDPWRQTGNSTETPFSQQTLYSAPSRIRVIEDALPTVRVKASGGRVVGQSGCQAMSFCRAASRTGPTGQGTSLRGSGASGTGSSVSCPGNHEGTPRPRKTTQPMVKNNDLPIILLSILDETYQGKFSVHTILIPGKPLLYKERGIVRGYSLKYLDILKNNAILLLMNEALVISIYPSPPGSWPL
jgi:hypothetical protein